MVVSLRTRSARAEHGLFVAEGARLVGEILASRLVVERLFWCGDSFPFDSAAAAVFSAISSSYRDISERISEREMERMSQLKSPSGVLAVVRMPGVDDSANCDASASCGLSLVLDCVQDPGNLGTIIRIADWYGISDIYCSHDTVDCYGSKVVQATMGAVTRVRVHYVDLVELLRASKRRVYGTFLDGVNIYGGDFQTFMYSHSDAYVVMGNEGNGISVAVAKEIDRHVERGSGLRLHIPSAGGDRVESLNVAVATAVVCSEFRRGVLGDVRYVSAVK